MDDKGFSEIILRCNGMLGVSVYKAIYELAKTNPGVIVEIGTAHGAATVALALGLRDSGKTGRVYSFDKMGGAGSSRSKYGSVDDNVNIVKRNLQHFGVDQSVELVVGDVAETASHVPSDQPLSLLMLDADGRIERDFMIFYTTLKESAPLVIDDYKALVRVRRTAGNKASIDAKMLLTTILLDHLVATNRVAKLKKIGDTAFTHSLNSKVPLTAEEFLPLYRELVFTVGDMPRMGSARDKLIGGIERLAPDLANRLRVAVRERRA